MSFSSIIYYFQAGMDDKHLDTFTLDFHICPNPSDKSAFIEDHTLLNEVPKKLKIDPSIISCTSTVYMGS